MGSLPLLWSCRCCCVGILEQLLHWLLLISDNCALEELSLRICEIRIRFEKVLGGADTRRVCTCTFMLVEVTRWSGSCGFLGVVSLRLCCAWSLRVQYLVICFERLSCWSFWVLIVMFLFVFLLWSGALRIERSSGCMASLDTRCGFELARRHLCHRQLLDLLNAHHSDLFRWGMLACSIHYIIRRRGCILFIA